MVQDAFVDQLIHAASCLERGIQLNQRIGPQQAGGEFHFDKLAHSFVPYLDETPHVGRIVRDQPISKLEDIHDYRPFFDGSLTPTPLLRSRRTPL